MIKTTLFTLFGANASVTVAVILGFFLLLTRVIKIVPQSEHWTLERFGKFTRMLEPGIHILIPIVDRIGYRISMRETVLDIPPQDVISRDNAIVKVDGVVFYRVFDAHKAAYMVEDVNFAITQLVMTNLRTVLGEMELDHMLSNREFISGKLLDVIDKATDPWGIQILRVEIRDIRPPHDLQEAMSRQMKAERDKRAQILEAEGERDSAILKANGYKESAILEAEGHRQSTILHAQAEKERSFLAAQARERSGEAEANAIRYVAEAIGSGEGKGAQYFLSEKYISSLQKMATADNSKTIFMPFEATKVVSGLGSLTELAKNTFAETQVNPSKKTKKNNA